MSYQKYVQMMCDECHVLFDTGHTYTWLRKEARKEGWKCTGKEDICPDCREAEAIGK